MSTMPLILIASLFAFQDAPPADGTEPDTVAARPTEEDALREENRRLLLEVERLKKELDEKEAEYIQMARDLLKIKQILKRRAAAPPPSETEDGPENPETEAPVRNVQEGPDFEIRGSIRAINRSSGFLVLNRGERDGVKTGYLFEILREATGSSPRIALTRVDKFLGEDRDMCCLEMVEGEIEKVKIDDTAVAVRKTPAIDPSGETPTTEPVVAKKAFGITGNAGERFVTDFGAVHGAKLAMKVYVRRDGNLIGTLRLNDVKNDYSIGTVVESDKPFQTGDLVSDKEPQKSLYGRIRWNDAERGIIIDLGSRNDAEPGMRFEARRRGQAVGYLVITSVDKFTSYVEPVEGSVRESFQKGDLVEFAPAAPKNEDPPK